MDWPRPFSMPFGLLRRVTTPRHRLQRHVPEARALKAKYDVVVIGGGGHGLATAYCLAAHHSMSNVAVLEKGYLAGGNTARNTMAVRANYMAPESIAFYRASLRLFEELSAELDFNVLFSQRGQLTLAHDDSTLEAFRYRAEIARHFGLKIDVVDTRQICDLAPRLNLSPSPRHPILGGLWHPEAGMARHDAVAWGYAYRASQRGVEGTTWRQGRKSLRGAAPRL
jgi:sarcosine oxidase subunit beta